MNKAKKIINNYNAPTPKKWQVIGKGMSRLSKIIAGATVFTGNPLIPFTALLLGEIGEFLVNLKIEK